MKPAVIYTSQTGFTKRYAEWICSRTGADLMELSDVKKHDLNVYDAVVFGGWACAGKISKADKFKKLMAKYPGKKYAVYSTGASPLESPHISEFLSANFPESDYPGVRLFYFPAGFNYEKMPALSRFMMKVFNKMLASKKDKTEEEKIMAEMIASSYDISDEKYIQPLVEYINGAGRV